MQPQPRSMFDSLDKITLSKKEKHTFNRLDELMAELGCKLQYKQLVVDGGPWLIYTKGDKYFTDTNFFARFEVRHLPEILIKNNKIWFIVSHILVKKRQEIVTTFLRKKVCTRKKLPLQLKYYAIEFRDHISHL